MNFEEFKSDFESKLTGLFKYELQEFQYSPYHMGSGYLVYRINGRVFRFFYDGREEDITCSCSKKHEKYNGSCHFRELTRIYGLEQTAETWKNIIESA